MLAMELQVGSRLEQEGIRLLLERRRGFVEVGLVDTHRDRERVPQNEQREFPWGSQASTSGGPAAQTPSSPWRK